MALTGPLVDDGDAMVVVVMGVAEIVVGILIKSKKVLSLRYWSGRRLCFVNAEAVNKLLVCGLSR